MRTFHGIAHLALSLLIGIMLSSFEWSGAAAASAKGRRARPQAASKADVRRPNIQKQNESTKDSAAASKSNRAPAAKIPAAKASLAKSSSRKSRESPPPRRELPSEYTISLVTNAPDADISIDGDSMGRAGKDGKLVARIKPGRHSVSVTHPQYRSLSRPIDVGPGLTELNFNLEEMIKPAVVKEAAPPVPPVTPEPPPKPAPSVDSILKRFLEGSQPDAVSADDWKEVLSQSEKALARDAGNAQLKARILFAHGQRAYLQGEFTLALIAFSDALHATPDLALAHYGSGNSYMATNLPIEAVKSYQRTVQLLPAFARGHKALGDALTKAGNRTEANTSYRRAKQLGYAGPDLGLAIARNLIAERRWLPALEELKSLAGKSPSAEVFLATGECYEGLNNDFSAALAFFKATDLDHNSSIAHYKLGLMLLSHREHAAAKDALERAIALDPTGEKINVINARERLKEALSKIRR